jgi:hypothetical protein
MDKDICLCLHIDETIMCTAEIGAIVGIFPDDTKLVRFNLGFRLVECATLVLLDNTIWINEKFDICWQRIP